MGEAVCCLMCLPISGLIDMHKTCGWMCGRACVCVHACVCLCSV